MKISRSVLLICSFVVLISCFFKIPYLSTSLFRIIVLLYAYVVSRFFAFWWERKIQMYKVDIVVEGIQVYRLPYKLFKSHNVMIFKGKKNNIIVEDEVMEKLSSEQLKAVLYHEVGHTHTINKEIILGMDLFALYFNSQGLHKSIYENSGMVYLFIGVGLFLLSEILKRFIEYKADKYVVQCGCDKETLISAIKNIEQMNGKSRITVSTHPSTNSRFRNLK